MHDIPTYKEKYRPSSVQQAVSLPGQGLIQLWHTQPVAPDDHQRSLGSKILDP